jgi:DNA-binding MarR family transcriptional regulator
MGVMRDDDSLGAIETEIAFLMRLGEATRRSTGAPHRALDRSAYVILRHLEAGGPQSVSALAERLNLDGSTVTRQVIALERDNLITRTPTPNDGRSHLITATPLGRKSVAGVRAARRDLYGQILAEWSADDRKCLADLLTRLNSALDAHVRKG